MTVDTAEFAKAIKRLEKKIADFKSRLEELERWKEQTETWEMEQRELD